MQASSGSQRRHRGARGGRAGRHDRQLCADATPAAGLWPRVDRRVVMRQCRPVQPHLAPCGRATRGAVAATAPGRRRVATFAAAVQSEDKVVQVRQRRGGGAGRRLPEWAPDARPLRPSRRGEGSLPARAPPPRVVCTIAAHACTAVDRALDAARDRRPTCGRRPPPSRLSPPWTASPSCRKHCRTCSASAARRSSSSTAARPWSTLR